MIKLDENYSIETDSYNVSLIYRREKEIEKNGELKTVVEKSDWHYPTLAHALKKYLSESLKECSSIEEVLKRIEIVENRINNL